ncbi:FtsK/SpoIIIE domain-containing protein [Glutamicibacter sp. MNS18]|uniref:FtsK/SpoIIIE domain-containing protein n=1 Tax=Glutamicibacter sp. MNS18 TaxID=2989817 RepID=UPI002236ABF5|nr:FtsK/SpoIIIE domain-containing protein [Glutamicibacter sp. MNS18]MCW4466995.1 FtsK/SpoIIIE domain-containing protein [Glutamicibacter sp. MNS18]
MALEFLLCSRGFARPRHFVVHSDQVLDGPGLQALLRAQFGPGPWFCAGRPLGELADFAPQDSAIITDVPAQRETTGPQALQLYVLDGPNAGAHIALLPGSHPVGRCAPLWLEDPALARVQATVEVDHRSITLHVAPGQTVRLLGGGRAADDGPMRLVRGALIRMGQTTLKVEDPLSELEPAGERWPTPPPRLPAKPEAQRLVTMLGAAVVPLAIGILLALLTGSRIFLVISGCTALLAAIPLAGLVRARIGYRRTAREHTGRWLALRRRLAPPLGTVIAAATSGRGLLPYPGTEPLLVLGSGRWNPESAGSRDPVTGGGHASAVFAMEATGAWQVLAKHPGDGLEVLCAILARLLPSVISGGPRLVIDPGLRLLPASLVLLPNISLGTPPTEPAPAGFGSNPRPDLEVLYLVAGTARPVPGALVIGLGPRIGDGLSGWVDVDSGQALLDDVQAQLDCPERLSPAHFARLVDCWLSAGRHRVEQRAPAHSGRVLHCALGDDQQGREVGLDLESDGPHVLVAGTTGSGKSEALRRIVAELVAGHSPQQLALALVDFKGGASLSVFARLPHTQLFSSDLDGAQALRMLQQLETEIRRREQLLHDARCSDIGEYQQANGRWPALPRLVVVIDEFRVFIDQLPEAGTRVDRIATVGRALGIHLLLSTQKPAGTLSGQTRANVNTVIALRVRENAESIDLVGSAQAAQLSRPGEAILRGNAIGATRFRFRLAAAPPPVGYLAERAAHGFAEYRRRPLGQQPTAGQAMELLRQRVERIGESWQGHPGVDNPFAPPLPGSVQEVAPGEPGDGQVLCGVLDDLSGGRLRPLCLGTGTAPALLVSGLPEAGGGHLAAGLFGTGHRLLYFDAAPPPGRRPEPHQVLLTGTDTYLFTQALDFLAGAGQLRGVLVVARNLAGLAAALPPALWARFDEVIATLIRGAPQSAVQVVIIGDRDLSALKATQLCTRRWYFPLGAPQGLTMMWPKLPLVSAVAGRGIQVGPDGQMHGIQLTGLRSAIGSAPAAWGAEPAASSRVGDRFLGTSGLEETPVHFTPAGIGFILVPDAGLRSEVARLLSRRWGVQLGDGAQELAPGTALVLSGAPDPGLAGRLNELAAQGHRPVVFCAPSARLAYDFGLPAMALDERDVLVVEAMHPFDMQPLNWPVLAARDPVRHRGCWRAVMLIGGQPAEVRIACG